MNYHQVVHLLVVLATLLQIATCFTARPLFSSPAITRFADTSDDAESEDDSSLPLFASTNDGAPAPVPLDPQQPSIPQQPRDRKMDPLLASLTRMDSSAQKTKSFVTAPLFGEIAMDGSLLVLIPAIVFAVVGFVMSVTIAFNSQDTIVNSLAKLSDDVTAAAVANTNTLTPLDGSCRGICSSQDTDLQSLKTFMDNISIK